MENYIGKICPFCKTEITEADTVKVCPACDIPHHESCWEENHGCTTFGCAEQHYEAQNTNPTDVCTNCGTPLGDGQIFCPKCGTPKNAAPTVAAQKNTAIEQFNNNIEKQQLQQKKKKARTLPIILAVTGALLAIIVAVTLVAMYAGPTVEDIVLSPASMELRIGDSKEIGYEIFPAEASDISVDWSSSNKSVATVNGNGKVTAKGEGTCTIKASVGNKYTTVTVKVVDMYEEEELALGTWSTIGFLNDDGDFCELPSSSSKFYVYRDFTGKMTVDNKSYTFTWEYDHYSDGTYYYDAVMDGEDFGFFITELNGENCIVAVVGSITVIFEK